MDSCSSPLRERMRELLVYISILYFHSVNLYTSYWCWEFFISFWSLSFLPFLFFITCHSPWPNFTPPLVFTMFGWLKMNFTAGGFGGNFSNLKLQFVSSWHLRIQRQQQAKGNTKTRCEICPKLIKKTVASVTLLRCFYFKFLTDLTHCCVCCLHCWLWTSKCRLGTGPEIMENNYWRSCFL